MPVTMKTEGLETAQAMLKRFNWTEITTSFADAVAPQLLTALRAATPVGNGPDPGRMRDRLLYTRDTTVGSVTMQFFWDAKDVPYAADVVFGHAAPSSPITPVAARALHWPWGSGAGGIFAKSSPGGAYAGNDFPRKVWDAMSEQVAAEYRNTLAEKMGG